ncbi:LOW QUALITY PROTEIN: hem peroxidase [Dillenia turbinata]|uniref:Hem peroxidase n=1 Tax=Dillenia turbinata TaxID=194707 RepID=A0AAN8VHL1_9MAGN
MFHLEGGGRRFMLMATLPVLFSMNESLTEGFGWVPRNIYSFKKSCEKFCPKERLPVYFVGMNGSIIYELERPENADSNILEISEITCHVTPFPLIVSWADMIDVGGAEAFVGDPKIPIQLGRLDSVGPDPEGKLPPESLDASGLKQCFQKKGFLGLVSLSGAHTLGSKRFGNPMSLITHTSRFF